MKNKIMITALGLVLLVLVGSFIAIGDVEARRGRDNDDDDDDDWEPRGWGRRRNRWSDARIRAVHLSPDAPAVDIWVDGQIAVSNLAFGEATDYIRVPFSRRGSTYNIQVVPTGLTAPVVINADLRLKPVRDYTIVASGELENIKPIVIEDLRPLRPVFRSWVRFAHMSPDAPNVDIAVQDGGPVLFSDVAFEDVENYISVRKGSYDLEVRVAGTNIVALKVDDVMIQRGRSYTIFATGLLSPGTDEPGLSALLIMDR